MTRRQSLARTILVGIFAALMIAAALVSWRVADTTTAAATTRADTVSEQLADAKAQIAHLKAAQRKAQPKKWHGFVVGEVIVCKKGYIVSVDDADKPGEHWAACM